jgi:hypothetical protein
LKIHFNIILLSTPGSSKWPPSLWFPTKILYATLLFLLSSTCPTHLSLLDHPTDICWGIHSIKLLVMQSSPLHYYLIPLRLKYLPQHPTLKHPQFLFLAQCERPTFTTIQNNRKYYV